jgi:hypothetical protein
VTIRVTITIKATNAKPFPALAIEVFNAYALGDSNLGLDAADRRKDRTNVELVVTATAGGARVAASAVSIDNQTGDTKMLGLAPVVGSGNPNVTFAVPVVPEQLPAAPTRHRGVHH